MPGIGRPASAAPVEAKAAKGKKRAAQAEAQGPANDPSLKQKKAKKAKVAAEEPAAIDKATAAKAAPSQPPSPSRGQQLTAEAYRKQHDITVKAYGAGAPALWQHFTDAPFPAALQRALTAAGFTAPSPIQAQAWPLAMTGRDVLATAKTGSGKTCGYLLPAIAKFLDSQAGSLLARATKPGGKGSPAIVVMSPTRELAVQINQQATTFARAAGLKSAVVYGGAPKGPQIRDLRSGASILVATPGRLGDLLQFQCQDGNMALDLDSTQVLVLDEADRMCDMGFEPEIRRLVALMPSTKQTLFFTATWPKAVERVAATILRNPIQVSIGSRDELIANKDIKQLVQVVGERDKQDKLLELLKKEVTPGSRSIIFCNKKHICDHLETSLWEAGYSIAAIHGDRSQEDREWAIRELRSGKMALLVATDVAARGLDIKELDRVINFDFPNNTEDYIHRIGRTGRAGASGTAHTFFTQGDAKHAGELIKILREAKQEVPTELESLKGGSWGGGGRSHGGNRWRGGSGGGGSRWRGGGGGGRKW